MQILVMCVAGNGHRPYITVWKVVVYMCFIVNSLCSTLLEDGCKLTECGITNGTTLILVVLPPFDLYIQDTKGIQHTMFVDSAEPEVSVTNENEQ